MIVSQEGLSSIYATRSASNLVYGRHLGDQYAEELRRMAAERLKACFPDARVVLVIREQISRLVSQYCSEAGTCPVSSALAGSVDRFAEQIGELQTGYDYDGLVDLYQSLFGKEKVLVLPFEWLRDQTNRFFTSICSLVGATGDWQELPRLRVNRSHKQLYRVMALRASRYVRHRLPLPGRHLLQAGTDTLLRPLLRLRYGAREVSLSPAARSVLAPLIAASNSRLASLVELDLADLGYIMDTQ
jgi:hypothetical protein